MLVEIRCDKFIENGKPRPPITFRKGLNVIIGNDKGGNSIGKSTFLMIIDFVFGGDDYVKVLTVIQDNIGDHTIEFKFVFNDRPYYFSRSTAEYRYVYECNENYQQTGIKYTIDEYKAFLLKSYNIDKKYGSLRSIVGRFFRIYNRSCMDEKRPLSISYEKDEESVNSFLALLGLKEFLAPYEKASKEAKEKFDYLSLAKKHGDRIIAEGKNELEELNKNLENIKEEMKSIDEGLLTTDSIRLDGLTQIDSKLSKLIYQRSKINSKLTNLVQEDGATITFPSDFENLLYYFPNADIKKLEKVEEFHKKINKILTEQISDERNQLQKQLEIINSEINKVKQERSTFQGELKITTVDTAAKMNKSKVLVDEKDKLEKIIKNTNEYQSVKKSKEEYDAQLKERRISLSKDLIKKINDTMKEMNNLITAPSPTTPPEISLTENGKNYIFKTPKDQGRGSQYKGMVIFDLTMLKMTVLPALVHDSDLLQPVANNPVDGIAKQYSLSDKQIFISVDKLSSYNSETEEIFRSKKVLELYPEGGELFGRAWNKLNAESDEKN